MTFLYTIFGPETWVEICIVTDSHILAHLLGEPSANNVMRCTGFLRGSLIDRRRSRREALTMEVIPYLSVYSLSIGIHRLLSPTAYIQTHVQGNTPYDDKQEHTAYNDVKGIQRTMSFPKIIQEHAA